MKQSGKAGDECLRCCHAELGPCGHREHNAGGLRQWAVGIVDDGCGQRACGIGHLDRLDEVVAPSGLRDREEELTVELEALLVDGSDIGRKSTDRDAEMSLDQMLPERRRMGRAPARAGKDKVRRLALEATQELS